MKQNIRNDIESLEKFVIEKKIVSKNILAKRFAGAVKGKIELLIKQKIEKNKFTIIVFLL